MASEANDCQQCDTVRPECTRCLKACVPCVYLSNDADATPTMALKSEVETLQRQVQEHIKFLENIRSAPEDEAMNIVRQLRSTEDISSVLRLHQGRTGGTSLLSEHSSAQAAIPSIDSIEPGIDFELVRLHPNVYPVPIPLNPSSIPSVSLTREPAEQKTSSSSCRTSPTPSETYTYCDPRLEHLTVGYWTWIPIDDVLAARAISHFFGIDHLVLGFFDVDLFLRDLVGQRLDFCSSFLFSSVMSLACVGSNMAFLIRKRLLTITAILQHD